MEQKKSDKNRLPRRIYKAKEASLVDALDKVIEKGAMVRGEAVINVADIELIYIGLQLVVSSVSAMGDGSATKADERTIEQRRQDKEYIRGLQEQLRAIEESLPQIVSAKEPQEAEQGLAKLVLTIVELLRQLLEREALRRIDQGNLSMTEIQKLGLTFQVLDKKIQQLKKVFGIKEELNINLGPLGNAL